MPRLIDEPTTIEEYVGHVNSRHTNVSVVRMDSPEGWAEPGRRPDFEEITVVLRGWVRVEFEGGADYMAVCLPAFTPDTVHRDPE